MSGVVKDGPASRLRFRAELWLRARLLPLMAAGRNLEDTLALAEPGGPPAYRGLPADYVVRRVRKSVRNPILMRDRRCLRGGLLAFRFLREAGYDPRLHFGVDAGTIASDRLGAHCWVSLDGRTVLGEPETPMIEIHVHPRETA